MINKHSKYFVSITIFILILAVLNGCTGETDLSNGVEETHAVLEASATPPDEHASVNVEWSYKEFYTEETQVPMTEVSLVVTGAIHETLLIETVPGTIGAITEDLERYGFPKNAIVPCGGYYAGAGDYFCVVRKDDTTLAVMYRIIYETSSEQEEDYVELGFEEVAVIETPQGAIINN